MSLAFWPSATLAQDWASAAYCDAPPRPVVESDFAPHDLTSLVAAAAQVPNGIGRFWRIEGPDGGTSHLWGTFHVSTPQILDIPQKVKDQIAAARVVALEIDFTFPDRESFLTQYDLPGRYRDPGDPFAPQDELDLSFLGAKAESWVYDRLFSFGIGEDALYVLTYAGLAELLLSDPCEDLNAGTIPVQDDFIHTLAHIAGAKVLGLETPGEFLTDLSDDDATAKAIIAVYASYLEPAENPSARVAGFQLYLEGRLGMLAAWDAAHMTRVFGADGAQALALTDAYLLDARNERFLERLAPELDVGDVFLAVGAAHLPGKNGLIAMLRNRGYDVSRVPLPGEVE
ncbi:MAG: TraB/GumN family protein [Pseudomonadota bacterium]